MLLINCLENISRKNPFLGETKLSDGSIQGGSYSVVCFSQLEILIGKYFFGYHLFSQKNLKI